MASESALALQLTSPQSNASQLLNQLAKQQSRDTQWLNKKVDELFAKYPLLRHVLRLQPETVVAKYWLEALHFLEKSSHTSA